MRRITSVNGVPAEAFDDVLKDMPRLDGGPHAGARADIGKESFEALRTQFDERFVSVLRAHGAEVHADRPVRTGYSTRTALDLPDGALEDLAPGADISPKAANFDGLMDTVTAESGMIRSLERMKSPDVADRLTGFVDGKENTFAIDRDDMAIYRLSEQSDGKYKLTAVEHFDSKYDAGQAFGRLLSESRDVSGGLPALKHGLDDIAEHLGGLGRPEWAQKVGGAAAETGSILGKASKILGPLGVAAAGAEAHALETKLQDYEEFGLVPSNAMTAYRGILVGHTAQATVDPSLLGGELVTQTAFDAWVKANDIDPRVAKELEPGSLLEDAAAAKDWLDAQAAAAGMKVADYATSRVGNPELILDDVANVRAATRTAIEGAIELAQDAGQALGEYARSRWTDPDLMKADMAAIGQGVKDTASAVRDIISPQAAEIGETDAPEVRLIDIKDAVRHLGADKPIIEAADPQGEKALTRAIGHPDAVETFRTLARNGVTEIAVSFPEDATPEDRAADILISGHTAVKARGLELHKGAETVPAARDVPEISAEPEYDYAL